MRVDVKENLSTLTTINELSINRLFNKITWIISDAVEQAELMGDDTIDLDLEFGSIRIVIDNNNIKYKFIPSKFTEDTIIDTIVNGKNQLTMEVEKNLVQKLTNIYKDMF